MRLRCDGICNYPLIAQSLLCPTVKKIQNLSTKITRKANDVAENLQLYRVVRLFRLRSSCTTADIQRITFVELAAVD